MVCLFLFLHPLFFFSDFVSLVRLLVEMVLLRALYLYTIRTLDTNGTIAYKESWNNFEGVLICPATKLRLLHKNN